MGKKNYAYINKDMLVWARSITPFQNIYDIQERTKIAASKIALWENGDDFPSINEAKKLAKLYKVPFAALYLDEPPKIEPKPYTDRRTLYDTSYGEISYELWAEIKRIISNREKMVEYADEGDEVSLPAFTSEDSIKSIADKTREFLGLQLPFRNKSAYKNAYSYYRSVLESHNIMVSQIAGVSLNEIKGISIYYDAFPIIAVNNKDYERAKAFSLMHEVAHLVRRSSSLCTMDFDDRNDEEERVCDRIAAEIMMPSDEFVAVSSTINQKYGKWSTDCLNAIGDRFAVSSFSVVRRLYELGEITHSKYQDIYEELKDNFEENKETIDVAGRKNDLTIPYYIKYLNKEGYLFTKVILSSYSRGEISYGEMCNTLSIGSAHIDKLERAVMFV